MKKNTVTLMLLAALGFGGLTVKAQTAQERANIAKLYDTDAEREFTNRIVLESEAKYKRALELARVNNWPLRIEDKETGHISVLTGLNADDTPIYKSSDTNVKVAETDRVIEARNELLLSLDGEDMIIGMWEIAAPLSSHIDLTGRLVSKDLSVFPGSNGESGHATHVAGTLVGSGAGNSSARGIAYNASQLWTYDSFGDNAEALVAANQSLIISNHSYGVPPQNAPEWQRGAYNQEAYDWDVVTSARPYYQPVFSAGNAGADGLGDRDLLVGNKNSKNVITVAATNYVQNYTGSNSVAIAGFSSPGPTDDYRVKPDIAGQGVLVTSCWSDSNNSYAEQSGTSMAAPGVAGCLALMQQHYKSYNAGPGIPYMKAATLRALMIHTADEAGQFPGPDFRFGWGLINARKAIELISNKYDNGTAVIDELEYNPGDEYVKVVTASGDKPVKATIAWTDPTNTSLIKNNANSANNSPVLINDLNIKITRNSDGTEYFPWKLNSSSLAGAAVRGINNVDNVEVVEASAAAGTYTITITGDLPNFDAQAFGLIIDGIVGEPLSIADNALNESGLKVYPNPANDVINISFNNNEDTSGSKIAMYDVQGRQVKYSDKFVSSINTADLASGLYLLNVTKKDGVVISKKVLIK